MNELRYIGGEIEMRGLPGAGAVVSGNAAIYDSETTIGHMFRETIAASAFVKTLKDGADVRAYINHDPNHLLARRSSGTLRLEADGPGLHYDFDMPDRQDARDAAASIERGDMTGSSFAFETVRQEVVQPDEDGQLPLRRLLEVRLYDISIVSEPAYEAANDVAIERSIRSMEADGLWLIERDQDHHADQATTETPADAPPAEAPVATSPPEPLQPKGTPLYVARLLLKERL